MEWGSQYTKMEEFSKDSITIMKRKGWDARYIQTEICTQDSIMKIRNMEKAPSFGLATAKAMPPKRNI